MNTPVRLQRKRTKGWRAPEGSVYVGRPSKRGNPYVIGSYVPTELGLPLWIATAEQAVFLFSADALDPEAGRVFRENVRRELRGKTLLCWCRVGTPCHADVLLKIANSVEIRCHPQITPIHRSREQEHS